jgi:hypothetical protein
MPAAEFPADVWGVIVAFLPRGLPGVVGGVCWAARDALTDGGRDRSPLCIGACALHSNAAVRRFVPHLRMHNRGPLACARALLAAPGVDDQTIAAEFILPHAAKIAAVATDDIVCAAHAAGPVVRAVAATTPHAAELSLLALFILGFHAVDPADLTLGGTPPDNAHNKMSIENYRDRLFRKNGAVRQGRACGGHALNADHHGPRNLHCFIGTTPVLAAITGTFPDDTCLFSRDKLAAIMVANGHADAVPAAVLADMTTQVFGEVACVAHDTATVERLRVLRESADGLPLNMARLASIAASRNAAPLLRFALASVTSDDDDVMHCIDTLTQCSNYRTSPFNQNPLASYGVLNSAPFSRNAVPSCTREMRRLCATVAETAEADIEALVHALDFCRQKRPALWVHARDHVNRRAYPQNLRMWLALPQWTLFCNPKTGVASQYF